MNQNCRRESFRCTVHFDTRAMVLLKCRFDRGPTLSLYRLEYYCELSKNNKCYYYNGSNINVEHNDVYDENSTYNTYISYSSI